MFRGPQSLTVQTAAGPSRPKGLKLNAQWHSVTQSSLSSSLGACCQCGVTVPSTKCQLPVRRHRDLPLLAAGSDRVARRGAHEACRAGERKTYHFVGFVKFVRWSAGAGCSACKLLRCGVLGWQRCPRFPLFPPCPPARPHSQPLRRCWPASCPAPALLRPSPGAPSLAAPSLAPPCRSRPTRWCATSTAPR